MSDLAERRRRQAAQTAVLSATVVARRRISPSFARLTLAGEGLTHLVDRGFDQWFRLFLPSAESGQQHDRLPLPEAPRDLEWYARFRSAPPESRPTMRYVTVREYRRLEAAAGNPPAAEIDVDVVIHGEVLGAANGPTGGTHGGAQSGPLSSWAQTAEIGERVALLDQGTIFRPEAVGSAVSAAADPQRGTNDPTSAGPTVLLLGDETAVPAIAGIARSLPRSARGHALIEVPHQDDVQDFAGPPGLRTEWSPRNGAVPGELALRAFRRILPSYGELGAATHPYLYAAGESSTIRSLNGLLRDELGWSKDRFTTVIYWHDADR